MNNYKNCTIIPAGTWVEIKKVILKPEERAPNLPQDTAQTPYVMRVSGWLLEPSEIGKPAKIKTFIGRIIEGELYQVLPSHTHSFGTTVEEILKIGTIYESIE